MRFSSLLLLAVVVLAEPASAQSLHPQLDADQSSRLQAALDAQGCAGGGIHVRPSELLVTGARCGDREYDLVFDREYKLLRKDPRG